MQLILAFGQAKQEGMRVEDQWQDDDLSFSQAFSC